jgi:hypothetical protein
MHHPINVITLDDSESWDSVVGMVTGYGLGDRGIGVRVPEGSRILFSPCRSNRFWGPPRLLSNWALSLGVKRTGREIDHSFLTSAEVKEMWIYTSTASLVLMT